MLPDSRPPALDVQAVRRALAAGGTGLALEWVESIDSTNAELLRRAVRGSIHGRALAAEAQTAGRGRLGRQWISAPGRALTFSLGWHLEGPPLALAGLSLATGVAVADALAACGAGEVRLKWPNDLLWGEGKLGGVLIETRPEGRGAQQCVIGVGINWAPSPEIEDALGRPVAALEPLLRPRVTREEVLAACLRQLEEALRAFARGGFAPVRLRWEALNAHRGRKVRLDLPGDGRVEGRCLGVADDGALQLETASGPRSFAIGEVSLGGVA